MATGAWWGFAGVQLALPDVFLCGEGGGVHAVDKVENQRSNMPTQPDGFVP